MGAERLASKVVVITGGGSGIGRACTSLFVSEGARVVVAELDESLGSSICAEVNASNPNSALFVRTDVTNESDVKMAFDKAADAWGRVDVIVNCAGGSVAEDAPVTDVDMAIWDHTIALDLKGPFLCSRVGIPHLKRAGGGSVVNFTSVVALKGAFQGHVYTSAKGGIIALTQALAGRYWRDGIRCNAIAPGVVLSDRVRARMGIDADQPPEAQLRTAQNQPSRLMDERHPFGFGMPEDIAYVALFLACDESRMINGAVIPAEGGASAY